MGKLEELEQGIYGKDDEERLRRTKRRVLFPKSIRKLPQVWMDKSKDIRPSGEEDRNMLNRKFLKFFLGGAGVLIIVMGSVFLFLYLGTRGQEAEVTIHDRGPVRAGELVTIPITFRNISSSVLKEVELTVILPEGSLVQEEGQDRPAPSRIVHKISDLDSGKEGSIEVLAKLFGKEGEEKEILTTLIYRPENLRARFSSKASKNFLIGLVPLAVVWEIPEIFSNNQEMKAIVRYNSSASFSFRNMWLRLEYPLGFQFISSAIKSEEGNNIWNVGDIDPGEEGSVEVLGRISGEEGEIKSFRAELGVFNTLTKEWRTFRDSHAAGKIAVTPLSITGSLKGSRETTVGLGENLQFTLRYKNNTEATLRNITVRATLEGPVLDFATLLIDKGNFDFNTRSIVWTAANAKELGELKPREEGEFHFEIQTKSRPAILHDSDKNQVVRLNAEIKPAFIPQEFTGTDLTGRDSIEAKVRTKMLFSSKVLYRSSPLPTSGPLPPKVGAKTVYTILWEIRNFTNDAENVQVIGLLPPNVVWENVFSPKDSRIIFDPATSEIRWNAGKVAAGTGINSPALTLAFQVSITPSTVDVGHALILLIESRLTGKDAFTGEELRETVGSQGTELRDDPGVSSQDGVVK
jgi:hypothetical protein